MLMRRDTFLTGMQFDLRKGATWHCIVGRNFGSFVTHGKRESLGLCARRSLTRSTIKRNQAFHILLPRALRHLAVQNPVGSPGVRASVHGLSDYVVALNRLSGIRKTEDVKRRIVRSTNNGRQLT